MKYAEKFELESVREELNLRLSFSASTCELFNGQKVDAISNLSSALGKKPMIACIIVPMKFVEMFFIPAVKLTGLFKETATEGVASGDVGQLLYRFVGSIKGLKLLGIDSNLFFAHELAPIVQN